MTIERNPTDDLDLSKIRLPEAPDELRDDLDAGRPVAWSEPLAIRTYDAAPPSIYPMYLDHRVYQGSSGKVYPIPFTEQVSDIGHARKWQAIHLENEYVRLVVLPELGGRIHIGYDKTTDYDFFYRNNVIKPALVGLAGPWISGGVEFNWPQHHRPATYLPVETSIEYGDDGSVTVWCADHDPFTRMAGQHGVRLRPGSSVVELAVRLHNRTSERQTFLWWANVAARVHDDYQSFFPDDVRYVADHARRGLTAFPAADRPYYGVDYPALASAQRELPADVDAQAVPGADRIDFYRNIPVPTSYMIVDSQESFFGGYDHAAGAGFVHWAERRLSPGKKQWTWGNAPFGHAWDAQLTDDDGPYVELMAGVYTDNQPDFSWLLPGETKVFTQYWYPIPAIGPANQATPDAAVHVDWGASAVGGDVGGAGGGDGGDVGGGGGDGESLRAVFAVTSARPGAILRVRVGGEVVASRTTDLVPGVPETVDAVVGASGPVPVVELLDRGGQVLVRWTPVEVDDEEPWVADEPALPDDITSVEELYLTGVHLSQFRHPTRSPLAYWRAALALDPGDVRTNLAVADHDVRAGEYERALAHVEVALQRLTRRNANPLDAEAFYLAGLALRRLGRHIEAEQYFGKAGWDGGWAPAAGFELSASLARRGQNRAALRVLDTLDGVVAHDSRRAALRAILLRRLGQHAAAEEVLRAELTIEPLNPTVRVLLGSGQPRDSGLLLDAALDLVNAGALTDALAALAAVTEAPATAAGNFVPIAHYIAAVAFEALGDPRAAAEARAKARSADLTWAFPNGLDAHDALRSALAAEPDDAVAGYLLGMLLYSRGRRAEALALWTEAVESGMAHPVLLRNAALASYNIAHDDERAWRYYEEAVRVAPADARLRYEQDQLAARLGHPAADRLTRLRDVEPLVLGRDDFTIEYVGLLIAGGRAGDALDILSSRPFHPWEGGEGRAIAAWDAALDALGLPPTEPPASLGEARTPYATPAAVRDDGVTDYFATSLPELLLFSREEPAAAP